VRVTGILNADSALTDNFIFLPITTLQNAIDAQGKVSLVAVKLADPRQARRVADTLTRTLNLEAQTQSDFLSFVDRALKISDAVRFGISLISLIVGGLAVANTVMMGVFERTREFGTLRAIGARPGFVQALVLSESLLLALVGGFFGVLLGLAGIWGVNLYTQNLASIDAAALTPRLVLLRHALRNAALPIVTMIGLDIGTFMGGVVVVESVFGWPGLGRLVWDAIRVVDIPVIVGVVIFSAFVITLANLLADLVQPLVDPRVRYR